MAESTPITSQAPQPAEESPSFSTNTTSEAMIETLTEAATTMGDSDEASAQNSMSIRTSSSSSKEDLFFDPISSPSNEYTSEATLVATPSPRALQSLVLAAASDLMEISPRSMELETPTSQAGTPHATRNPNDNNTVATNSTTPDPTKTADKKPKGILKKNPRYTVSVPMAMGSTSEISPTTGNTIHNINQFRKNRSTNDFDFSDIDRLVDKDDDDFYNGENAGSTTLLSILWSLVVLPIVLLGYGGVPYLVLASLVWTLIFVARWVRRFLVEEFSMRRNHDKESLNAAARNTPIPSSLESPFGKKTNSATNLKGILASISPIAGARKTKVHFPEGIKFPERQLLRQPIPRIRKPPNPPRNSRSSNMHKKPSLFFGEEENTDGDSWSLDSLMVLRNYMKDTDYHNSSSSNNNSSNTPGMEPTPMSVLAPPPPYPPTLSQEEKSTTTIITAPPEIDPSSGDEADDECNTSSSSLDEDASENDQVPEILTSLTSDRHRRDSVMFFPQEFVEEEDIAYESRYGHSVQPTIQLADDEDDEPIDDSFHEGLFGKSGSSSPTTISDSKLRKKASRYRRRKPRDSLCFTYSKKTVVPECPSIPQCPSDELEFLEQKKQEKFEQAVVIEHHYHESPSTAAAAASSSDSDQVDTTLPDGDSTNGSALEELCEQDLQHQNSSPLASEETPCDDLENEIQEKDEHSASSKNLEEQEDNPEVTISSITKGSWDDDEASQTSEISSETLPIEDSIDDEICLENDDKRSSDSEDQNTVLPLLGAKSEPEISDHDDLPDLNEEIRAALKDTEDILASFAEIENTSLPQLEEEQEEPTNDEAQGIETQKYLVDADDTLESTNDVLQSADFVQEIRDDENALESTDSEECPIDEESSLPIVIKDDDCPQSSKALGDELPLDEEVAPLLRLDRLEEGPVVAGNTGDAMSLIELEEPVAVEEETSLTVELPVVNDLEDAFVDEETTSSSSIDELPQQMEEASVTVELPATTDLQAPIVDEETTLSSSIDELPQQMEEASVIVELPAMTDLQAPIVDEETTSSSSIDELPQQMEEASVTVELPATTDLQAPIVDEETTSSSSNDESPQPSDVDELSLENDSAAMTNNLTQLPELEEAEQGKEDAQQILEPENIDIPLLDVPPEPCVTGENLACSTNDGIGLTNPEDLSPDEGQYSTIIDEALQKSNANELPILDEATSTSDDDFPQFNVMQEISFDDESDDVECILSPHAFKFEEDDAMFRDRDPVIHVPFPDANNKAMYDNSDGELPNDPMIHEVLTTPSDLQIEMAVTNEDIECILSPMPTGETDANSFDENDYSEAAHLVPSPRISPENKENLEEKAPLDVQKDKFYVDTTAAPNKALDDINLPWSPAFPRAVLSPTNQRPTRS